MNRVVENVLLHGQNGKKSKKVVRVFGIFKSDSESCFLDSHKKSNDWANFLFFFNRREILSSLIYHMTIIDKIWTVFEL